MVGEAVEESGLVTSPEERDGPSSSGDKIAKNDLSKNKDDASSSMKNEPVSEQSISKEDNNEYMFDGFDFSTGVSICQELDMDEEDRGEEGRGIKESLSTSLLGPEGLSSPTQLSNALLKVLGVNGRETEKTSVETKSTDKVPSVIQRLPPATQEEPKSTANGKKFLFFHQYIIGKWKGLLK